MRQAEADLFISFYGVSRASQEQAMCRVARYKDDIDFSAEQAERLDMLSTGMDALLHSEGEADVLRALNREQAAALAQRPDMRQALSMDESRVLKIYADKLGELGELDGASSTRVFEVVANGLHRAVGFRVRLFQSLVDGVGALPRENRLEAFARLTYLATTALRPRSRADAFPALAAKLCKLRPPETLEAFHLLSRAAAEANAGHRPGQLLTLFLKDAMPALAAWNETESQALSAPSAHIESFIDAARGLAPKESAAVLLFAAGHIAGSHVMSEAEKLASYRHLTVASEMLAPPERIEFFSALMKGALRRTTASAVEELSLFKKAIPELDEAAASALSALFES